MIYLIGVVIFYNIPPSRTFVLFLFSFDILIDLRQGCLVKSGMPTRSGGLSRVGGKFALPIRAINTTTSTPRAAGHKNIYSPLLLLEKKHSSVTLPCQPAASPSHSTSFRGACPTGQPHNVQVRVAAANVVQSIG